MRTLHIVTEKKNGKFYTEWYDENYECKPNTWDYNCERVWVTDEQIEQIKKDLEGYEGT